MTLLIAIALAFLGNETVSAEEPPNPLEQLFEGWSVEGNGTYFEITNSSYLNVTLISSENIHIYLESILKIIYYYIDSNCSANSTLITLSNLEADKTYYLYQDGNLTSNFTTDQNGSYSYTHYFNECHQTFIQETISTIYIKSDGSIDPPSAPISRNGDIYTLTGNVYEQIHVEKSGITLDGDGYTIQCGDYGLWLNYVSGVTVKNFEIDCGSICILDYYGYNNLIENNTIKNAIYGIYIYSTYKDIIDNNIILNIQYYGIMISWYCAERTGKSRTRLQSSMVNPT